MSLLGGKNGTLRCAGQAQCPQCGMGESFDPILHAQAEARARVARETGSDPAAQAKTVADALAFARWLVKRAYMGWPLAYAKASRKYGVPIAAIRSLGAQRAANTRLAEIHRAAKQD